MPRASTLFLDRDGVINTDPSTYYVLDWDGFQFNPGVLETIPVLNQLFEHIVIVTNQQGVGKGLMSESTLEDIHFNMLKCISSFGGHIDLVMACTDLASDPDHRRKPRSWMGLEAQSRIPDIDFSRSWMVGDQPTDIEFGINLGMSTAMIGHGAPGKDDATSVYLSGLHELPDALRAHFDQKTN
jgi:D-glycero-D-manno-heptose 1,7-bisphosphate phosphatase